MKTNYIYTYMQTQVNKHVSCNVTLIYVRIHTQCARACVCVIMQLDQSNLRLTLILYCKRDKWKINNK